MKARRTDSMEIQSQPSCDKLGETTQEYRHDLQSDRNRERQLSEYLAARGCAVVNILRRTIQDCPQRASLLSAGYGGATDKTDRDAWGFGTASASDVSVGRYDHGARTSARRLRRPTRTFPSRGARVDTRTRQAFAGWVDAVGNGRLGRSIWRDYGLDDRGYDHLRSLDTRIALIVGGCHV